VQLLDSKSNSEISDHSGQYIPGIEIYPIYAVLTEIKQCAGIHLGSIKTSDNMAFVHLTFKPSAFV
jgi:hypothetical protein